MLYMMVPNSNPILHKHHAPMGPQSISSTGAGDWMKAPVRFPDGISMLDEFL